ncbi:glycosyltransferase [Mumia sp. zg.B21]|uniref:glycosyltransferase n=1 Tax=Mumia sp. zg.B21 TaxID=2855447 RepID=UPI001C6E9DF7|nr:glycosyltransferase [Mumia sp. zg.B21]MBW9210783.1 glycosyltransferase [Mumia sp. zg.B21]
MKIVVAHGRYRSSAPSGENVLVDQETEALRTAGHQVVRFERDSDEITGWSLADKAMLPARSVWNGQARADLAALLETDRPDVLHLHNTFPLLSPSVLAATAQAGVPVVATVHNYKLLCASGDFFRAGAVCHDCAGGSVSPALVHGCYRGSRAATVPVTSSLLLHRDRWRRLVSAFVFISAAQRDAMRALGLPRERVFVKHNHVPDPGVSTTERQHAVVYVGRLDHAKGLPFLLRAWDELRRRRPGSGLRLHIVGGGPLEDEVRRWAEGHPSVDVRGTVSRAEAVRVLARGRAAVVPSQWEETFGLVAIEALAVGTAPLVSDHGSFPELVGADVGARFAPGSVTGLVDLLADVDDRPEVYLAKGSRGRRHYEESFGPERDVEELLEIYRFAVARPVTPGRR